MVVTVGLTVGLLLEEVNPLGLLVQLYVFPTTADAPILVEPPLQIVFPEPTVAVGTGFTVIFTESDLEHPVAVTLSVR